MAVRPTDWIDQEHDGLRVYAHGIAGSWQLADWGGGKTEYLARIGPSAEVCDLMGPASCASKEAAKEWCDGAIRRLALGLLDSLPDGHDRRATPCG